MASRPEKSTLADQERARPAGKPAPEPEIGQPDPWKRGGSPRRIEKASREEEYWPPTQAQWQRHGP